MGSASGKGRRPASLRSPARQDSPDHWAQRAPFSRPPQSTAAVRLLPLRPGVAPITGSLTKPPRSGRSQSRRSLCSRLILFEMACSGALACFHLRSPPSRPAGLQPQPGRDFTVAKFTAKRLLPAARCCLATGQIDAAAASAGRPAGCRKFDRAKSGRPGGSSEISCSKIEIDEPACRRYRIRFFEGIEMVDTKPRG